MSSTRTSTGTLAPTPVSSQQQAKPGATASPASRPGSTVKPKDARVQLQYLKDDPLYKSVKPLQITPSFADREGRTNVRLAPGPPETIKDVRSVSHNFTLDNNGFKYVKSPTKFKDWSSQPKIAEEYLPELEALLRREIEGCDEILFYDARIRQEGDEGLRVEGLSYNPFARQVHVDNTEPSVLEKIRSLTEIKADYLLRPDGRARAINIWRPIKHPVYDCSLAIADGGKLQEGDVIECERRLAKTGAYHDTMGVVQYRSPGYDWYYCSEQDEEDVLIFKNYDSATDVKARLVMHTAFDLPPDMIPIGAPTRESVEVRALVFTYPTNGPRPTSTAVQHHPLAVSLQQSNLKRLDDEHVTITDRLRTDIDEAQEVKDAVLLLRRQEIRRLERVQGELVTARDGLLAEVISAQQIMIIKSNRIAALEAEVQTLQRQLHQTSRDLTDTRLRETTRARDESDGVPRSHKGDFEKELLLQTIDHQEEEIAKWKAEAMGRGNEAVSTCWQGSVDTAVRREREKDAFVIQALRDEVERLKLGGAQ